MSTKPGVQDDRCPLLNGVIHCLCGKPSSHYATMGLIGALRVLELKPPDATTKSVPVSTSSVGKEAHDHPDYYGGKDNPYEAIKVIEAWQLGFCLGNTVKYIVRAGKKGSDIEDLKKARWYLDREIQQRER